MTYNAPGFVANAEERLLTLATQVATHLNAPPRSIYLEAVYQAASSPCTAEEILNGWLAITAKGGRPRQIAMWAGKADPIRIVNS